MKLFKKIAILLLCLTVAFSLFACDNEELKANEECKSHVDENKDGKCDECGDELEDENPEDKDENQKPGENGDGTQTPGGNDDETQTPGGNDDETQTPGGNEDETQTPGGNEDETQTPGGNDDETQTPGGDTPSGTEQFLAAVVDKVSQANTVNLAFNINVSMFTDEYKNAAGEVGDFHLQNAAQNIKLNLTVAKTEGGFDLVATVVTEIDDGSETHEETETTYIIDGKVYDYSEYDGFYLVEPVETGIDMSDLEGMIAQIFPAGIPEIPADVIASIKEAVVLAFDSVTSVDENGNFVISYDGSEIFNSVIEFVKGINLEEDTLGDIINRILAMLDPELTAEALLDGLVQYGSVTVGEIYDAIETVFIEETGMGIQGLYDEIVNNEQVIALLVSSGASEEDIAMLQAIVIADYIAEYEALTVDDLLNMLMNAQQKEPTPPAVEMDPGEKNEYTDVEENASSEGIEALSYEAVVENEGEEEKVTIAALVEMIKTEVLAMPVAAIIDQDTYTVLTKIKFNALKADIIIKVGENYEFEGLDYNYAFNFEGVNVEYDYIFDNQGELLDAVAYYADIKLIMDAEFSVTSISDEITVITLPEGAIVVNGALDDYYDNGSIYCKTDEKGEHRLIIEICEYYEFGGEEIYFYSEYVSNELPGIDDFEIEAVDEDGNTVVIILYPDECYIEVVA